MASLNFEYLRKSAPVLAELGEFAELYLNSDPDSALTKLRGFCEASVKLLYSHQGWDVPQKFSLDQLIHEADFTDAYPKSVLLKLDYIRVHGNKGAHSALTSSSDALAVLREAYRIGQFLYLEVFNGDKTALTDFEVPAAAPKAVETAQSRLKRDANINSMMSFLSDELASKKKSGSREGHKLEVIPDFNRDPDDSEYRAAGDPRPESSPSNDKIKQVAITGSKFADHLEFNEDETRKLLIDVQLARAGWRVSDSDSVEVEREVSGQPTSSGIGYIDYVLKQRDSGKILALIEAKRASKEPADGKEQARLYADGIEEETGLRPLIFFTNGYETWLWDDHGDSQSPPRKIHGFYSESSIDELIWRRTESKKLSDITPDEKILGDRDYQYQSLEAICSAYDSGKRRALAVQATGTGKTRLAIALADVVLKANVGRRVLFLCDRRELRKQAKNAFDEFLGAPSTILSKDSIGDPSQLFFATYPAMAKIFKQFDPGFFHLIIADESHRSIYNVYGDLFRYFDGLQLGLTATPVEMISRSTCRLFDCDFNSPTANYSLEPAVRDKFLVPFSVVKHTTQFLREGIKGSSLTTDQIREAEERGEDLTQLDFDAEQIDRAIHNKDTNRKVLRNLMENGLCLADGQTLGKTIIFARNHRHAVLLEELFNEMYPQYGGRFCKVIDNYVERAEHLIDEFKSNDSSGQGLRIAISVDMLDTGIDVPEILNIVFARPVKSPIKFWQMIGRGTRTCKDLFGPGQHKTYFKIFDHWGVVEAHGLNDYQPSVTSAKPLAQKLFESRIELAKAAMECAEPDLFEDAISLIHAMIAGLDRDSIVVRENWRELQAVSHKPDLMKFSPEILLLLEAQISNLMRYLDIRGLGLAYSWDLLISELLNSKLRGSSKTADLIGVAIERVSALRLSINQVREKQNLIKKVKNREWWVGADISSILEARIGLRDIMQYAEDIGSPPEAPLVTDIPDTGVQVAEQKTHIRSVDYGSLMAVNKEAARFLLSSNRIVVNIRNQVAIAPHDIELLHSDLKGINEDSDLVGLLAYPYEDDTGLLSDETKLRMVLGLDKLRVYSVLDKFADDVGSDSPRGARFALDLADVIVEQGVFTAQDVYRKRFTVLGHPDDLFTEEQLDRLFELLREFAPTYK